MSYRKNNKCRESAVEHRCAPGFEGSGVGWVGRWGVGIDDGDGGRRVSPSRSPYNTSS